MGTASVASTPQPFGSSAQELESIERQTYEAFNAHRLERVADLIAPECEFVDVPSGAVFRGPREYIEYNQAFLDAFSDGRLDIVNVVCRGDLVVTESIGRGTHDGVLALVGQDPIPPTGKQVELPHLEIVQIRDGKIVRGRIYYDLLTLLRELGVAK